MQQAAGRQTAPQAIQQPLGQDALLRTHRGGVPLRAVHIVDGDEGRLAPHGQANVVGGKILIDSPAQRLNGVPLRIGIRQRDARVLMNARDGHLMGELYFAGVDASGDRSGRAGFRRRRKRDVPFPGEQARCRIQADPSRAG